MRLLILLFIILWHTACNATTAPPPPTPDTTQLEQYLTEQKYEQALHLLERWTQDVPQAITPLLMMGDIYQQQRQWLLAEDAYNRALARAPADHVTHLGLAEIFFQQGRWNEAERLWRRAVQLTPTATEAWTGLGRTALARLNFAEARTTFATLKQTDARGLWYLACLTAPTDRATAQNVLAQISDSPFTRQRDYLQEVLAQSKAAELPTQVGVGLAQLGEWSCAYHALTVAIEQAEPTAETWAVLGQVSAQLGLPASAHFDAALDRDPDSALAWYLQGRYFLQQKAFRVAEESLMRAISLEPRNPALYSEIARFHETQGRLPIAEAWHRAAIEVADAPKPFERLLVSFYGTRSYKLETLGIPFAEELLADEPADGEVLMWYGVMLFASGDTTAAETSLRQAVAVEPNRLLGQYYLARTLVANGRLVEAREFYQQVIDRDTSTGLRERARRELLGLD